MVTSNLKTYYGHYSGFNLERLKSIRVNFRQGRAKVKKSFCPVFLMADTETSKTESFSDDHRINRVVCWSVAMRYDHRNIFAVYGRKPSELCAFLLDMKQHMNATHCIIYWHNLSYDWQFIRKFCFSAWGHPVEQLNTKSHYPINIEFSNGIIFRDSLILSQVSLARWGQQMGVEHGKAVDCWDYEKIRTQYSELSEDELLYIYDDVLCGVECLDELSKRLNKKPYAMPWTATGIVREQARKVGKKHHAHDDFIKQAFSYDDYRQCEQTYHGAFTHANRYIVNHVIKGDIRCYDFASSYPFVMVSEKFPCEKFMHCPNTSITGVMNYADSYAFLFKFTAIGVSLRDQHNPMPFLQASKCVQTINAIFDNGRILEAELVEIYLTEVDLQILQEQYIFEKHICSEVMYAKKDYLPRWFTDMVFQLYENKCTLKHGDKTEYSLSKARVNSLYGMCVQKLVKMVIEELYEQNEYSVVPDQNAEDIYEKEINKKGMVLNYQTGVWITAYACRNLFELGKCFGLWCYSDTDSCYGTEIDSAALQSYNQNALQKLRMNGYDLINVNGETFQLGEATLDGTYSEFITTGAKRYTVRDAKTGKLKITVSGVPKAGVDELKNDITNFKRGLIFRGSVTGKQSHFYGYVEEIYVDSDGCEQGDFIDLDPCDYLLDDIFRIDTILFDEIGVTDFEH